MSYSSCNFLTVDAKGRSEGKTRCGEYTIKQFRKCMECRHFKTACEDYSCNRPGGKQCLLGIVDLFQPRGTIPMNKQPILRKVEWNQLAQGDRIYLPGLKIVGTIASHELAEAGEFFNHDTQSGAYGEMKVSTTTAVMRWEGAYTYTYEQNMVWFPVD